MNATNILLAGMWGFAIVWLVGSFLYEADLLFSLMIFLIAIGMSAIAIVVPKGSGAKLDK